MIPQGVPIYVATQPVDLRYGMERLGGLVREWMGQEPRSPGLFVFIGKRKTAMKLLTSDRTGGLLLIKRLDAGVFSLPEHLGVGSSLFYRLLSEPMFATWFAGNAKSRRKTSRTHH